MSSNVALITGATGQDGAFLAECLLGKGYEVRGAEMISSKAAVTFSMWWAAGSRIGRGGRVRPGTTSFIA